MGCCSARACKVLPNTSRPSIVLRGAKCACARMAAASTWPPAAAWGLPACGQRIFPELDSMTITLPRGMGMPIFSTEQLPHGPSEAMAQVSCCMRPAGAPNALASTKRAQQQGRWISRPARRCLSRLRARQCADAGPRPRPLTAIQRGHDVHVASWLQRAPSIGCSMGAACMWSEGVLWAVSHGDRAALRN